MYMEKKRRRKEGMGLTTNIYMQVQGVRERDVER